MDRVDFQNETNLSPDKVSDKADMAVKVKNKRNFLELRLFLVPLLIILSSIIIVSIYYLVLLKVGGENSLSVSKTPKISLKKFVSVDEFKNYLAESEDNTYFGGLGIGGMGVTSVDMQVMEGVARPDAFAAVKSPEADRVSQTNNQLVSVDEADIVKTDSNTIYYSSSNIYRTFEPLMIDTPVFDSPGFMPPINTVKTKVIGAYPPSELKGLSEIDHTGNLLLSDNVLIVISSNLLTAYDVSEKSLPKKLWDINFGNSNYVLTSRLYKGKVYLVTQSTISKNRPCPIPLMEGSQSLLIACSDIYYPDKFIPVDTTYSAIKIDPETGSVDEKISFVGSTGSSVIYVSESAIYVTYNYYSSIIDFAYNFFAGNADLIDGAVLRKLDNLRNYDISERSKMTEFGVVLEDYFATLGDDERLRIENEIANRMDDYILDHGRDLQQSGIVKIALDKLGISATGTIPGVLLNQFSMDEYNGNLRLATTVGQNLFGNGKSANDVYVLNENLDLVGSVVNLGLTERVYSARFIADKGYIVTFRQTDPFYVLDLSTPTNPVLAGELKVPGYSSYLHPITDDQILGIGVESGQVKLSLFDVTDPKNPLEIDKYLLDEYYSEVSNNHHAFLMDQKHKVFFLPGSKGGYIFSYANGKLELKKAVQSTGVERAIYLDDYMYIIGGQEIVVINENDWQEVNSLTF